MGSLAATWICSVLWITLTVLMIPLKRRQKFLQKRELAESIEDAAIFASARQLDPTQNIMMKPIDQMSQTSNQSSVLSQKPSVISGTSTSVSTNPMGKHMMSQQQHQPVVVQQQMMSQQELLNQQMLQMQQLQLANQQRLLHHQSQPVLTQQVQNNGTRPMSQQANYQYQAQQAQLAQQQNGVQYVQLSNGLLVPVVAQQQTTQ